jgi:molybdate transport system substrate-binding protein
MAAAFAATTAVTLILIVTGCGSSRASKPTIKVAAAASLKAAFTRYGRGFKPANVDFSFAGSDLLAAQIEQGIKPDVFAAANLTLPQRLYARRLMSKSVVFAGNRLVLAVPARSTKVRSLSDAEQPGITIAIGSPTVPVGAYTRDVLARLGKGASAHILANVRSQEPDVSGIVGKLTQGAVDAGFTYVTDVRATNGKLAAIALPRSARPVVSYGIGLVEGSTHRAAASQFIRGLLAGPGRSALLAAGFLAARS